MLDWLWNPAAGDMPIEPREVLLRLLVSALYGGCVAVIYRASHGRGKDDAMTMISTLVLLSILIAMVAMVIGSDVARAFSLVGALSIVRFRTVVDDTRDTAFVIFAVIVGMAAGAGLLFVPLVGIPAIGAVAIALSRVQSGAPRVTIGDIPEHTLAIRLGLGRDPQELFAKLFDQHLASYRLIGTSTARQGAALDLNYRVRLRPTSDMPALVGQLNKVEGVQSVEMGVGAK
jgi:hypothetical protein